MKVVALTTTHRIEELRADACTATLAGVHVGRVQHDARQRPVLELLVLAL
jgi:hypothetical protein